MRATQTVLAVTIALVDGLPPPANLVLHNNGDSASMLSWDAIPDATSYLVLLRRPGSLVYDDQFVIQDTSRVWDGFVPTRYEAVAIAARDVNGLTSYPTSNKSSE